VFEDRLNLLPAFKAGDLDKDCVVVCAFLKDLSIMDAVSLTVSLTHPGRAAKIRFQVALVTDGRMLGPLERYCGAYTVYTEAIKGG